MSTLFALVASFGTVVALLTIIVVLRSRLRLVRALTFILCLAAVAAGLAVYRATGVSLFPEFERLFTWLLVTLVATTALRLIALYVFDVHLRIRQNVRVPPLMPVIVLAVAYLLAALLVLRAVYPELSLAPLFATSAVTSLVLGLALQPILGNFFAGFVISFEQPYRINDWLKVGGTEGRVIDITWRTTHLRTRDNDTLIIPNSKAADEYVLNYHYPNTLHLARIHVGAHYAAPPYRVKQALLAAAAGVSGILENPAPDVYVIEFAESAVTYELRIWIDDMAAIDRIKSDVRANVWESYQRGGLVFPFPTRTLEFRGRQAARPDAASVSGRMFIVTGTLAGTTVPLPKSSVTVGRSPENTFQLQDNSVSKEHARFEWAEEGCDVIDLNSTGGTFVNGARVDRHRLAALDRVKLGDTVMIFEFDDR